MEKKIKKLKNSQVELEVKLTDPEFQEYYQPVYDDALAQVEIKGYRKGTAPKDLADAYINKEKVFSAAVEEAVRFSLDQIKNEDDWTLIDQPHIEVTNAGPGLTYKATLTLFPEVDLADYKSIAKKVFSKKIKTEVSEEELKKTTEWILNSRAKETRVSREGKEGDMLEIDLDAFHQGEALPNSSFRKEKFILGDSRFITGFDKEMAGKKEGEEFSFKLKAPKDYWQKELAEKELEFKGKVHGVYEREVPEFTDAFAQSLGPNFKTADDVKKSMQEGLHQEKENKEKEKQRIEALKEIAESSKMEIPEILVERTLDGLVADVQKNLGPQAAEGQDPEKFQAELRKQLRKRAEENVASHLVIYKIAQQEKLEPTKEEVGAQAAMYGLDPETQGGYIYDTLQAQKVFAFLESQAKPEEKVEKESKKEQNEEKES